MRVFLEGPMLLGGPMYKALMYLPGTPYGELCPMPHDVHRDALRGILIGLDDLLYWHLGRGCET